MKADGRACPGTLDRAWALEAEGGVVFQVRYTCPEVPGRLTLAMPMLDALAPGHRHMARLFRAGKAQVKVLDRAHATWNLDATSSTSSAAGHGLVDVEARHRAHPHRRGPPGLLAGPHPGGRQPALAGGRGERLHARALDHPGARRASRSSRRARASSSPRSRSRSPTWAIENLFVNDASKRWRITFPFGLIHGFGFAGALREIALPRAQVPIALVSFNLGVELGQLAVLSIALPLALAARNAPWFGDRGVRTLSIAIAIGGGALFVARLASR